MLDGLKQGLSGELLEVVSKIDDEIGSPLESVIGIVGDIDDEIIAPLESLIGIIGDFGEEIDTIDLTAGEQYDPLDIQVVSDKLDELIDLLGLMGIVNTEA